MVAIFVSSLSRAGALLNGIWLVGYSKDMPSIGCALVRVREGSMQFAMKPLVLWSGR